MNKLLWALTMICITAIAIAFMKYAAPLVQHEMDIQMAKWILAPKLFSPSIPPLPRRL